jgi:hypothetical protein
MDGTYYVVMPFDRAFRGDLKPGDAIELPTAGAAETAARGLALRHVGVVAFSRTGDLAAGEFQDAVVLVQFFGEVDLDALSV